MKEDMVRRMAEFMKYFSDPTRLKLLLILREGEKNVGELAELLELSQSGISHQLSQLRAGRLVKYRREGKVVYYSLDDQHVELLLDMAKEHLIHQ